MSRSTVTFLLIASFGILLVGCSSPEPEKSFEEFTFSENDLQRTQELLGGSGTGASSAPFFSLNGGGNALSGNVVLDIERQKQYDQLRSGAVEGENVYRVTNDFLNVRQDMNVTSAQIGRLDRGDPMVVLDMPNAGWAKVKLSDGKEGYVALRYIAKVTTEEKLASEKKLFEGKYFVDFQFLNVRKEQNQQAEKIGELPGQTIITPLSINGEWARIAFEGKEGFVSSQYLKPFLPSFLVRQDSYPLPILRYKASDSASLDALGRHIAALKAAGKRLVTLQYLYDVVQQQENKDVRIDPAAVVLIVSDVNAGNVNAVSNTLQANGAVATLFVAGKDTGLSGVTEKMMLTLMANGNSIQAQGHTGDDLRSLTDSQVELELTQSKRLIEDSSHKETYAVLYPQGGVNDRVMKKAAAAGYLFGLSDVPDTSFTRTQFLRVPTTLVSSSMTAEEVVKLVQPK